MKLIGAWELVLQSAWLHHVLNEIETELWSAILLVVTLLDYALVITIECQRAISVTDIFGPTGTVRLVLSVAQLLHLADDTRVAIQRDFLKLFVRTES